MCSSDLDLDSYFAELGRVRRRGYALDNGENEIDGRCVAVPVVGSNLPAAVSLSAPAARFPLNQVEEVAETLKQIVAALVGELRSPGP